MPKDMNQVNVNNVQKEHINQKVEKVNVIFVQNINIKMKKEKQNVKIVCIADSNVLKAHPQKAQAMCDIAKIIEVSGGEKSKCFEKASEICSRLAQMGFDRKGHIVAWGGGVIGDLAGFVASILEEIPAPAMVEGTPQMLVSSLEYSPYVGRIAIGRITRGELKAGMPITLCKRYDIQQKQRIKELMVFTGLGKAKVDQVQCGDICALVGIEGFEIGDTIADAENPEALPPIAVDEPTMSMLFCINNSPFFGKEGKFVTSRHLKERLDNELEKNLALRVKPGVNADSFIVYGRGVLHLSVLIETMRREGFELQVGQPKVLDKTIGGQRCEPIENLTIDVPEEYVGKAIELTTRRKGALVHMEARGDRTHLEFDIPSRGIIGLRSNLLTASAGEAVVAHRLKGYEPYKGEIEGRTNGSLVSLETGLSVAYSMDKLQDRGRFFIDPGVEIYEGQVVGEHTRERDLNINICKTKKLTNVRAAGSDEKVMLPPPIQFSLEEALEYIQEDELVEVTPKSMRIRKIILDATERKRKGGNADEE
jgi:GTP-binding protein